MLPPPEPSPRAIQAAEVFAAMAKLVSDNLANGFAGAFVIIPPGDGGPHTTLLLDPSENIAAFWGLVQVKATMALAELEAEERQSGPFGRR